MIKAAIAITIPICTALLFSPKRRQNAITMTAPTISATQMGSGTSSVIASRRSLRAAVKLFTLTTAPVRTVELPGVNQPVQRYSCNGSMGKVS